MSATPYANNVGQTRYQPTLSDGRGLYPWAIIVNGRPTRWVVPTRDDWKPKLYRSRRRAERIARRQERREWRQENRDNWKKVSG